jgi:hypothetical protein
MGLSQTGRAYCVEGCRRRDCRLLHLGRWRSSQVRWFDGARLFAWYGSERLARSRSGEKKKTSTTAPADPNSEFTSLSVGKNEWKCLTQEARGARDIVLDCVGRAQRRRRFGTWRGLRFSAALGVGCAGCVRAPPQRSCRHRARAMTVPAERSGDGALDVERFTILRRNSACDKAVSRRTCHRTPKKSGATVRAMDCAGRRSGDGA